MANFRGTNVGYSVEVVLLKKRHAGDNCCLVSGRNYHPQYARIGEKQREGGREGNKREGERQRTRRRERERMSE